MNSRNKLPTIIWMMLISSCSGPWVFDAAGFRIHPMNWAVLLVMISYFCGVTAIQKVLYDLILRHQARTGVHAGSRED